MFTKTKNGMHLTFANGITMSVALREDYEQEHQAAVLLWHERTKEPISFRVTSGTGYELFISTGELAVVCAVVQSAAPGTGIIDLPASHFWGLTPDQPMNEVAAAVGIWGDED